MASPLSNGDSHSEASESSLSSLLTGTSETSNSTIVEIENMGRQDHILSPLLEDPDPPASKNTPTSPTLSKLEELKLLSERAKACDLDPQLLLLAEIMSKTTTPLIAPPQHSQPAHIRYHFLAKQVGILQENEDIFAVLNRFQYNLKLNNVSHAEYLRTLPAVLRTIQGSIL